MFLLPKKWGKLEERQGAAWMAGYAALPQQSANSSPKIALRVVRLMCLWNRQTFGYSWPIQTESRQMKVFSGSNPMARMSLMFSYARLVNSSRSPPSLWKYFSSSVIWMMKGTLKASCIHLQKMKGSMWPRCSASEEGPLPVQRQKGGRVGSLHRGKDYLWLQQAVRMASKSLWEKNMPRLMKQCAGWLVIFSILLTRSSLRWQHPNFWMSLSQSISLLEALEIVYGFTTKSSASCLAS